MPGDEWEPDEADRRRIDRLAARDHLSEADARAIVRFANTPRDKRTPELLIHDDADGDGSSNLDGITAGECKAIRRRMSDAERPTEVVDDHPDKHASVIFRHAQGRCNHDHGVEPTTSPRITSKECYDMRRAFAKGDDVEDLLDEFHRSNNAVTKHVFGRCDHDLSDFDRDRVTRRECDRMRRVYRSNPNLTVPDVGAAFTLSLGAAHAHLSGKCDHAGEEPPIDPQVDHRVTTDECDAMRRHHKKGKPCKALSEPDEFDLNYQTVVRHVFGRCVHTDNDEPPAESDGPGRPTDDRAAISKQDCAYMRRDYKHKPDLTVVEAADKHGVGKGTLYYHVLGRCRHDSAREAPARNKRSTGNKG